MATVSSHTLNSVDGSHAGGIGVRLVNLSTGSIAFDTKTDRGGRLSQEVAAPDPDAHYELIFQTGAYWQRLVADTSAARIIDEVAVRFTMPQPDGCYHMPLILSPHGYSLWCSAADG